MQSLSSLFDYTQSAPIEVRPVQYDASLSAPDEIQLIVTLKRIFPLRALSCISHDSLPSKAPRDFRYPHWLN